MKWIDLHCDTVWKLQAADRNRYEEGKQCGASSDRVPGHLESLYHNHGQIDIDGMKQAGTMLQFFASFVYMDWYEFDWGKGYEGALSMIQRLKEEFLAAKSDLELVTSYQELMKLDGKMGAMLTVEEGGILDNQMQRLYQLYEQGIRLMTLTWNYENCIGFPSSMEAASMERGLKPFGAETVEEMNRIGMLVDVSHLSDGGFWDVLAHSKKPVVASHSNARVLCPVPRNLSDEMLKALGEQGGIAGVNFYPYFVKQDGSCTAADLAEHVLHMIGEGGEDLPAVGTDFDGYDRGISEITHIREMDRFYDAMQKKGLSERQIEKVCCGNALRIIKDNL